MTSTFNHAGNYEKTGDFVVRRLAFLSPCDEPFSTVRGLRLPKVTFAKGLSENEWLSHERSRLLLKYNWQNRSFENYEKYSVFLPQMTVEEKLGIVKMWRAIHDVFSRNNITYSFMRRFTSRGHTARRYYSLGRWHWHCHFGERSRAGEASSMLLTWIHTARPGQHALKILHKHR